MNELSKNQLHYLNMHRRHKRIIVVSRVSILLTVVVKHFCNTYG